MPGEHHSWLLIRVPVVCCCLVACVDLNELRLQSDKLSSSPENLISIVLDATLSSVNR